MIRWSIWKFAESQKENTSLPQHNFSVASCQTWGVHFCCEVFPWLDWEPIKWKKWCLKHQRPIIWSILKRIRARFYISGLIHSWKILEENVFCSCSTPWKFDNPPNSNSPPKRSKDDAWIYVCFCAHVSFLRPQIVLDNPFGPHPERRWR